MKFFVVFLFALGVAIPLAMGAAVPDPEPCDIDPVPLPTPPCTDLPPPPSSGCSGPLHVGIGTLFYKFIHDCVVTAITFVLQLLFQLLDCSIPVPIATILPILSSLGNPTVGQALQVLNDSISLNLDFILAFAPCAFLNTQLVLSEFLPYLANELSGCVGDPTLAECFTAGGKYLAEKSTPNLAALLNAIQALA